jgi:hypothetical protein
MLASRRRGPSRTGACSSRADAPESITPPTRSCGSRYRSLEPDTPWTFRNFRYLVDVELRHGDRDAGRPLMVQSTDIAWLSAGLGILRVLKIKLARITKPFGHSCDGRRGGSQDWGDGCEYARGRSDHRHRGALARVERDIWHAQTRIARQIEWIEKLRRDGRDTTIAKEILAILKSCLALHEQHRATLQRKLAEDPRITEMLDSSRVAIARSLQLLNGELPSSSGEGK